MQLPKVVTNRFFETKEGESNNTVQQLEIPEGPFMDEYKKLLGDAQARISVSADMALKDFGSGAGAMVTVTISCNQDKNTIEQAIDLAGSLARAYCAEQRQLAEKELENAVKAKANPYGNAL